MPRRPAATYSRSCRYGSPPPSRPVRMGLPRANTDARSSPGPTTSARRPSGAAPPKSASPGPGGSKRAASTPSSRATATAGASSTEDVPPLNASSAGWKHEWSPLTIRMRGIEPVRLHADLTILAKLACALARAASRTAHGVAVRSTTYAWSAVLHPTLHSPLQGSASARPVDQPVSKECSRTNAELPMSTPSFANRFANPS